MKSFFCSLIIFFSVSLSAQELKPLKPILENALNTNDNSMLAYSIKRCVYLNFLMGTWMREKGGSDSAMKEAVKNYFNQADKLRKLAFQLDNKIEKDRGVKLSTVDEWLQSNHSLNLTISKLYVDRLANNIATSGSYFGNDIELKNDVDICRDFMGYINR
jgi:hypothetical protein